MRKIDDINEEIQSMHSAAADIQRILLSAASKGTLSEDRRRDIKSHAIRIADLANKLGE